MSALSATTKTQQALTAQLIELTSRWTEYEDIAPSQKAECKSIVENLNKLGGMSAMQDAYYEAKGYNRAASSIQTFWGGVGEWRW
jgi:hypothetical protein